MAAAKRRDDRGRLLRTGEGQREDGRYSYRYTDLSGKRKMVYALTLADLREKEKKIARDLEDGIDTEKGEMTLNELFDLYMGTKTRLRDSTRHNYLQMWDSLVKESVLGEMKINSIKQIHIRQFYTSMQKKQLSAGTQKNVHNLISAALELATESDFIRKNYAIGCSKYISGETHKREALTREEQSALMDFVRNSNVYDRHQYLLTVFLNTGLRMSELAGLRKADVDLKAGVLHVRQQVTYRNHGDGARFHVQDLKTAAGCRDIPLLDEAKDALIGQKRLDLMMGVQRKEVEGIKDLYFVNRDGGPLMGNNVNIVLGNIVNAYNKQEEQQAKKEHREPLLLPHITAHILRHTFCSRMVESGIPPKTLQVIMGHADVETSLNIYTSLDYAEVEKQLIEVQNKIKVG